MWTFEISSIIIFILTLLDVTYLLENLLCIVSFFGKWLNLLQSFILEISILVKQDINLILKWIMIFLDERVEFEKGYTV